MNSSRLLREADLRGTRLSFLPENPILRSHLRSVRVLTPVPNSLLIISITMSSCHEPDSKPYHCGLLLSQPRTARRTARDNTPPLPLDLLLNLPLSPRSRIRTNQSRAVEYAMPRSPAIPRMLRPLFLSRHAKSLSFARGFFSLPAILPSLSSLVPGMNLLPDSSLGLLPPFPSPLRGVTQWHCRALIHLIRMKLTWPETVDQD